MWSLLQLRGQLAGQFDVGWTTDRFFACSLYEGLDHLPQAFEVYMGGRGVVQSESFLVK